MNHAKLRVSSKKSKTPLARCVCFFFIIKNLNKPNGLYPQTEYLVKWKDTEEWKNSCSWVKESDFVETELLDQFKTDEDYHFDHQRMVTKFKESNVQAN